MRLTFRESRDDLGVRDMRPLRLAIAAVICSLSAVMAAAKNHCPCGAVGCTRLCRSQDERGPGGHRSGCGGEQIRLRILLEGEGPADRQGVGCLPICGGKTARHGSGGEDPGHKSGGEEAG